MYTEMMAEDALAQEGYGRALDLLRGAATAGGFVASISNTDNYRRVWGRDGVIASLAALVCDDRNLHDTVHATLTTLRNWQGPHGEIPSNVDPENKKVSYGGTAGRVDASLWWLIGCHRYWQVTGNDTFIREFLPAMKKVEFLLGAWEFNTKGLLYIPETGDWSDEYIQHGYVLYDQLLYWRALLGLQEMYRHVKDMGSKPLIQKIDRLQDMIQVNYWFYKCDDEEDGVYHPVLYKTGCEAAETKGAYWMPAFSPTGYNYRFDSFANVLVSLFGIADNEKQKQTDAYIADKVINPDLKILPAFWPVIQPIDEDWKRLQVTFSYTFRNEPYQYHNGGLWPLLNGFYVADLAARGEKETAQEYLLAIHRANKRGHNDETWGFHEYINGKTLKPGGTRHQTWSAAAAIIGHQALAGTAPL